MVLSFISFLPSHPIRRIALAVCAVCTVSTCGTRHAKLQPTAWARHRTSLKGRDLRLPLLPWRVAFSDCRVPRYLLLVLGLLTLDILNKPSPHDLMAWWKYPRSLPQSSSVAPSFLALPLGAPPRSFAIFNLGTSQVEFYRQLLSHPLAHPLACWAPGHLELSRLALLVKGKSYPLIEFNALLIVPSLAHRLRSLLALKLFVLLTDCSLVRFFIPKQSPIKWTDYQWQRTYHGFYYRTVSPPVPQILLGNLISTTLNLH